MAFIKYTKTILLVSIVSLLIISATNFIVDPLQIYPSVFSYDKKNTYKSITEKIITSKHGLIIPNEQNYNEFELKKSLLKYSNYSDCAIIGSSRSMQISSYRKNSSLSNICPSMINLAVSGASLHEYIELSKVLVTYPNTNTIVFVIDPWSLVSEPAYQWKRYVYFFKNPPDNNTDALEKNSSTVPLIKNLFNYKYLMLSLKKIFQTSQFSNFEVAPFFDTTLGIEYAVILPDGSNIPAITTDNKIINGIINHKINDATSYNKNALKLFSSLIMELKKQFNIVFVMTPYHPKVWKINNQPIVKIMESVESEIHVLAKSLNIVTIGSYNPAISGCLDVEFYDNIHMKDSCTSKLK
ncbi:hypothetical protein OAU40_01635 [Candidatus Pseudothioglobus singularis]|jgi:hypothetical protein|nr:hypothetical protein [Candidatus Pseudothioglobus singularis]